MKATVHEFYDNWPSFRVKVLKAFPEHQELVDSILSVIFNYLDRYKNNTYRCNFKYYLARILKSHIRLLGEDDIQTKVFKLCFEEFQKDKPNCIYAPDLMNGAVTSFSGTRYVNGQQYLQFNTNGMPFYVSVENGEIHA